MDLNDLFPDFARNRAAGVCACCGEPIGEFRDEISRREFRISGLRQECQDVVFSEPAIYPEDIEA